MLFREKLRIVLLSFVLALVGCAENLTAPEHVARAKQYIQENETKSAEIELKNALKKSPNSPEARFMLGELYATIGNGPGAEKELDKARELGVSNVALLKSYATALILQRKYRKLLDEVEQFDTLPNSDREQLHVLRGDAYLETGKFTEANSEYDQALALAPQSIFAALGHIKVANRQNDDEKIETLLAQLIVNAPQEPLVWRFQGDLFVKKQMPENAIESYSKALGLNENDFLVLATRALLYLDLGEIDKANQDVSRLLADAPHYYMSHYASGRLLYSNQDYVGAQTALQESLKLNDEHLATYYYLSLSQLLLSQLNQADQNIGVILSNHPNSVVARQVSAAIQLKMGNLEKAKSILEPVLQSFPDNPGAIRLMARIELGLGNSSAGIEYLERLVELTPDQAGVYASLGAAQLLTNQGDLAIQSLEKALNANPELARNYELMAFSYIQGKQYGKALETINKIRAKYPEQPTSWNLEGVMNWNQHKFDAARLAFQTALKKQPGMPGAAHYLAQLSIRDKELEQARDIYQQVLIHHPDHYNTDLSLAELEGKLNDNAAMEKRLSRLTDQYPGQLKPRLLLATHYLRFGKVTKALSQLGNVDSKASENAILLALLTEAELQSGRHQAALGTVERLTTRTPDSAYAHFLAGKVYQATGNLKGLKMSLNRALELDGEFKLAHVAMMRISAYEGDTKAATASLSALLKQYPKDHEVLSLAGWYALHSGEALQAEGYFKQSLELYPSTVTVLELSKAQLANNDLAVALKTLEQWNQQYPEDVLVRYGRSAYYQMAGEMARAEKQLETILEAYPNYPYALNDLAWLVRQKQPKRALLLVEKALESAPGLVGIVSTHAMVLAENGQYEQAIRVLDRLIARFPGSGDYRYYRALVIHKKGDSMRARALLEELLAEDQPFSKKEGARKLLQSMSN